jgi:hypothetical protein
VFVEVQFLYREGIATRTMPRVIGQIFSDRCRNVPVLLLRPLGWTQNQSTKTEPLATLWHPACVAIGYDSVCFRGMESVPQGTGRRWVSQKWLCDVLDYQLARARQMK